MLRLEGLKLSLDGGEEQLKAKAAALLGKVSRSTAEQPDLDLSPTPEMV